MMNKGGYSSYYADMKDNRLTILLIAIASLELCILGLFLHSLLLIMTGIIINIVLTIKSIAE